jgi:hypothetical protein
MFSPESRKRIEASDRVSISIGLVCLVLLLLYLVWWATR